VIHEILPVSSQRVHSNYQRVISINVRFFRSGRRYFSRPEFLGHWKAPGSNKQDIGETMKRKPDRRPRKLRIDGISKLAIVRVRGPVLKNRSGVIGALNEAIKNRDRFNWAGQNLIGLLYMTLKSLNGTLQKTQESKDPCNFLHISGYVCADSYWAIHWISGESVGHPMRKEIPHKNGIFWIIYNRCSSSACTDANNHFWQRPELNWKYHDAIHTMLQGLWIT
jgi:hypothetical protein